MKSLAIAAVLALGISAPAFAHTKPAAPAPQPAAIEPVDETAPLDTAIENATTPQDRIALMKRCAGPPPRPPAYVADAQPADAATAAEKGREAALQVVAKLTQPG